MQRACSTAVQSHQQAGAHQLPRRGAALLEHDARRRLARQACELVRVERAFEVGNSLTHKQRATLPIRLQKVRAERRVPGQRRSDDTGRRLRGVAARGCRSPRLRSRASARQQRAPCSAAANTRGRRCAAAAVQRRARMCSAAWRGCTPARQRVRPTAQLSQRRHRRRWRPQHRGGERGDGNNGRQC
jgi:hypothetical protein